MSIEYERKLNTHLEEFCKFRCQLKKEYILKQEESYLICENCEEENIVKIEYRVSPCEFCKIKEFIEYIRDED